MPRKEEVSMGEWKEHKAMHRMMTGVGVFIFGLALWWTYSQYGMYKWDIAFMVIGILMFLKGLYMKGAFKV